MDEVRKKPLYKKWWFYLLSIFVFILLTFGIPIIINELYKVGEGYYTLWDASDVLSFYAVVLSGLITIGALIVTIYFSRKDTERQINFYMAQTNTPFFTIERIWFQKSKQELQKDNRVWSRKYRLLRDGKVNKNEPTILEIELKNIGTGIALTPTYRVDMFSSQSATENVISLDKSVILKYDLQKNLEDKWVNAHFTAKSRAEGQITFHTYIELTYQNTLGINFLQTIPVMLDIDHGTESLALIICEISPQNIKNSRNFLSPTR